MLPYIDLFYFINDTVDIFLIGRTFPNIMELPIRKTN